MNDILAFQRPPRRELRLRPVVNTDRGKILGFIKLRGALGATHGEIESGLSLGPRIVRARCLELASGGWIASSVRTDEPAGAWIAVGTAVRLAA